MSTIDQRSDYLKNPYFKGHIFADFSPFYFTIAICTIFIVSIILLNAVCCLCSKHKSYWRNKHTGNRWLSSIWTTTPHKQPPLDLTELENASELRPVSHVIELEEKDTTPFPLPQQRPQRPHSSRALLQQHRQREEFVEFKKRESDI